LAAHHVAAQSSSSSGITASSTLSFSGAAHGIAAKEFGSSIAVRLNS
jgi:hypothetical protein